MGNLLPDKLKTLWQGVDKGRLSAEEFQQEDRPHHVTLDFNPTFRALESLGFVEVWRDERLWGHQIFSRP
jgi:hypothetical protein